MTTERYRTEQYRDEEKVQEPVGRVRSIRGSEARIGLFGGSAKSNDDDTTATVGKFLGICRGQSLLVGIISEVSMEVPLRAREDGYSAVASVDLMGEITNDEFTGGMHFHRGVTQYPDIGDPAILVGTRELGRSTRSVDPSRSRSDLLCKMQGSQSKST